LSSAQVFAPPNPVIESKLVETDDPSLYLLELDCRANMGRRYSGQTCPHCPAGREDGAIETSHHWLSCEAYSELRAGLDPKLNLDHRVVYLRRVQLHRMELEKELAVYSPILLRIIHTLTNNTMMRLHATKRRSCSDLDMLFRGLGPCRTSSDRGCFQGVSYGCGVYMFCYLLPRSDDLYGCTLGQMGARGVYKQMDTDPHCYTMELTLNKVKVK
jgi:hypothetical protein